MEKAEGQYYSISYDSGVKMYVSKKETFYPVIDRNSKDYLDYEKLYNTMREDIRR